MKKSQKNSMLAVLAILFVLAVLGSVGPMAAFADAPAPATLQVIKQVINNGGIVPASVFNLHVKLAGVDVASSSAAGLISPGRSYTLAAGAYVISEDSGSSYTQSFSGDCDSNGNITLAAGDDKTCTLTNTMVQMYLPPMPTCEGTFGQVISPVNYSGFHFGNIPEEWQYFAVSDPTNGDSLDNSWVQGGNQKGNWVPGGSTITWDLGTSTKNIRVYPSQDHGGYPTEYFNEYAVQVSSDNLTWQDATIGATYAVDSPAAIRVHDGARDFSSTTPFRYVKMSLSPILGNIGGCDFEIDAVKSCAINIPPSPPTLTVTKVVINDNGGTKVISDFPLFIDGMSVTSGVASTTSAGAHLVSETADSGYTSIISGNCAADGTITLLPGEVKTCTITNNDIAPVAPGGGGGGGGGNIPLCILTNTCGSTNSIFTSAPADVASSTADVASPLVVASSTNQVLGEKITTPVTSQVLVAKITAKPAEKILSKTGFNLSEFLTLLAVLLILLNLIFIIKTKYLKTTLKI